ncbi:hypothetical protein [Enterococcus rivorum]|nr:hypothetical protein [Enterococcus rivorum]MBP2100347.1 hypothetical protein [Enterococcus rivorum]
MKDIEVPRMIQIGSTGRNSGKTTMAKELIAYYCKSTSVFGLKIITITGDRGKCQRGAVGCGICTSIDEGYELIEEKNSTGTKDTMELLKTGCEKVYLLKVFREHLLDGFLAFLELVPADSLIVCESNSIREVVKPGVFVMMDNKKRIKETAARVIDQADIVLKEAKGTVVFDFFKSKNGVSFT